MREKLRNFLIKLLGGTTADELDEIRAAYQVREYRLESQIRRMKSCIHVVRAEMSYTQLMREDMTVPIREYMVRNIANRLIEEVMPMVEISEKKGEYMSVYTITGTLRVCKEDN